jgi:hypothetical protein
LALRGSDSAAAACEVLLADFANGQISSANMIEFV